MKPADVKTSTYIDVHVESNDKDPNPKVGDYVRISKYKDIFAKGYTPNWSDVFAIKKVKKTVPWIYLILILKKKKLLERFMNNNFKRQIKQSLELKR